jgi:5'-nucleotidase
MNTTPLIVLVDIDRPLAQWEEGLVDTARALFPHLHTPDAGTRLKWDLLEGLNPEEREALIHVMSYPTFYRNLKPQPGSVDALNEMLAEGIDVRLCSTPSLNNPTCASDKLAWVEEIYGLEIAKRTILTLDKTYAYGHVIIDDKDKMEGDIPPFWTQLIFDSAYNQETEGPRMFGWSDWRQGLTDALGETYIPGMRFQLGHPLTMPQRVAA